MHELTFETFMETPGNRAACQASKAAAQLRPDAGRPLVLVGPPSTGKTHLLCAIVDYVRTQSFDVALAFVRASEFPAKVRRLAKHPGPIQQGRASLLLVDDLESFTEHLGELERVTELFLQNGHNVVFASAEPTDHLPQFSPWFRTLLANGKTVALSPVSEARETEPVPEMEASLPAARFERGLQDPVPAATITALTMEVEELRADRERLSSELEAAIRNAEAQQLRAETETRLRQELEGLRAELAALRGEHAAQQQHLAEELDARRVWEAQLEEERHTRDTSQTQLEERAIHAATEAAELRRQLNEERSRQEVLRRALSDTSSLDEVKVRYGETVRMQNEQLDTLREELRTTRLQRAQFERQLEQMAGLPAEMERLKREVDVLRGERENLKAALADTTVLDQLKARHEETARMLRGQLDMLRLKLEEARKERIEQEREYDQRSLQAAERIAALRRDLDESVSERQQLYQALSDTSAMDELREWHAETARYASDQLDTLRTELRQLRALLDAEEKRHAAFAADAHAARAETAEMLRALREAYEQAQTALADTSALDAVRAQHAQAVQTASALVAEAQTERDKLSRELGHMRLRLQEKAAQVERLKTDLEVALSDTSALDALRERHTEAVKAANNLRAELAAVRDERDRLDRECQQLQRQTGELDSVKALLQQSLSVKIEETDRFQTDMTELRRQLTVARAETEAAVAAQERLQARLAERAGLESLLAQAEAGQEKALAAYQERSRELELLETEKVEWELERERLMTRLAQQGARIAELANREAQWTATLDEKALAEQELAHRQAEVAALQRDRQRLEKRIAELEVQSAVIPKLEEERRTVRRELWDTSERLTFAEAELAALKEERARLRERASNVESMSLELAEMRQQVWRLAERVCLTEDQRAQWEAEAARLASVERANANLSEALTESCAERAQAQEERDALAERLEILQGDMRSLLGEKIGLERALGMAEELAQPLLEAADVRDEAQAEARRLAAAVALAQQEAQSAQADQSQREALEEAQRQMQAALERTQAEGASAQEEMLARAAELADLQTEIRMLSGEQERLRNTLVEKAELESHLEEAQAEHALLQNLLERLRGQWQAAQDDCLAAKQEREQLQALLRDQVALESAIDQCTRALEEGREEEASLREGLQTAQTAAAEHQRESDHLQQMLKDKSELEQSLAAARKECEELAQTTQSLDDEITRARQALQEAAAEHARLQTLADEKKELDQQRRAIELERLRLVEEVNEHSDRLERLRAEIRTQHIRQSSLRDVIDAKDSVETQLQQAQQTRAQVRGQLDQVTLDLESATTEVDSIRAEIARLEAALAAKENLEQRLSQVSAGNDSARAELEAAAQRLQELTAEVHAGKASLAYAWQEALGALEQLPDRLHTMAGTPHADRLREVEKELAQVQALSTAFQRQVSEIRDSRKEEQLHWEADRQRLQEQLQTLETRNRQLQEALTGAHNQLRAGEQALEKARAQFTARTAEMARHIARLESALQEETLPVPRIENGGDSSAQGTHPMETRLANFFEMDKHDS